VRRKKACVLQLSGSMAGILLLLLLGAHRPAEAQQLEPRAYSPSPTGLNIMGLMGLYTTGGIVTDPTSPIQNLQARVSGMTPYYARTFAFLGRQASVTVMTPFAEAKAHGDVLGAGHSIDRAGVLDPQVRFAVNLLGGPALTRQEFRQHKPDTTLGASITVNAPFGQYDPAKLINLGTNRWACKPELGISQPAGHWIFELYAGVWLFEANDEFYGGKVKRQDPLASYQGHIVYEVHPRMWAAADFTYYVGGETTLNGTPQNDRQGNTRGGLTVSVPVAQAQSLKLSWSRGVSTRIGSNFDTFGAAWQWVWF
jgi:hypothetical protein